MADDSKKRPEFFGEFDEDGWDSAIEEWGRSLEVEMPAGSAAPPAAGAPLGDDVDPMMALVADGEIDFEEGAGAALGSLLGAPAISESEREDVRDAVAPEHLDDDIGISLDDVAHAETDIEVRVGWDTDTTPVGPGVPPPELAQLARRPDGAAERAAAAEGDEDVAPYEADAPTGRSLERAALLARGMSPADAELPAEAEPATAPAGAPAGAPAEAPALREVATFTEVALLSDVGVPMAAPTPVVPPPVAVARPIVAPVEADDGIAVAKLPLRQVRQSASFQIEERVRGTVRQPELRSTPAPVSLDVFDELVPAPAPPLLESDVEAGQMLPVYEGGRPPRTPIFDGLEESDEAPAAIPALSDALCRVDLHALLPPEVADTQADWPLVRHALRGAAERAASTAEAAELEALGALAAERLGATEQAIDLYREVLHGRPKDIVALHGLWRLLRSGGREGEARSEVLETLGEAYQPQAKCALALLRAEHLWSGGGDDAGARTLLAGVGTSGAGASLRALLLRADLASASGDRQEQQGALDALIAAIEPKQEPRIVAALRLEQGRLREVDGVPALALESYQQAAALDATAIGAWEGLCRAGTAVGRWDLVGEGLRGSAAQLGNWEGMRLRRRAVMMLHGRLEGDAIAALTAVRERDEEDLLTRQLLAEEHQRRGDAAAAELAWRELGSLLPTARERAHACFEAGGLAERREGGRPAAVELYELALRNVAGHTAAAEAVVRLQRDAAAPEDRLEAQRAAAAGSAGAGRASRHLNAAAILAAELQRAGDALEELRHALAADPRCALARTQLLRALQASGDRRGAAELLETAAGACEDPVRAASWLEDAGLVWAALGQPERAVEAFRGVLERDAARTPARWGLQRGLTSLERWDDLAEELGEEARASELDRASKLWRRRADELLRRGRWDEAKESYQLAAQGSDAPWASWSLARAAARQGHWDEVGEHLAVLAEQLPPQGGAFKAQQLRLGLLRELALDDASGAALAYEAAAEAPHAAAGAREGLARGRRLATDAERLLELREELARSTDEQERFGLLIALGELLQRQGTAWDDAEEQFRKALHLRADHPVARRALEVLYHGRGAWQSLSDLMFSHLATVTDVRVRVMLHERLAERDCSRGDLVSAALTYDSILEHDAGNVHALRFLARRYLEERRWRELATTLRAEAAAAAEGDQGALQGELARILALHPVLELRLAASDADDSPLMLSSELSLAPQAADADQDDHLPSAAEAFDAALASRPRSTLLMQQALAEARTRADAVRVSALLLRRAEVVADSDAREAAALEVRASEARGHDLALYASAVQRQPGYLGAIYQLRDGALRAGDWRHAALAAEAETAASRRTEHRLAAHLLAGALGAERLSDPEQAMTHFRAALELDPQNRHAFDRLGTLLAEAERWDDLVLMLQERIAVERDTDRLGQLHQRLASIASERVGNRELARAQLLSLLEFEPTNAVALDQLADLYEADERWSEAADALIRRARLEKGRATLRDLLLRLGCIYQDRVGDAKRAILSLTKVLALEAGHYDALRRLSDLYMKDLDFEQALKVTTDLFDSERDPQRQVDHLLRIANIHEDGLRDSHRAAKSFRQALELAPADLKAIGALCGFYARQGDQRSVMIHLDRSVATMRNRLKQDPFEAFAYRALFKIFGWRKHPDGCLCAAQVLEALGSCADEERDFVRTHAGGVGAPGSALGAPEHDEWTFLKTIPGGFRQIFQSLDTSLNKVFKGDVKKHGVGRSDRVSGGNHPVKALADGLARDFGVADFELYVSRDKPAEIAVENTTPPSIVLGHALLQGATEEELLFLVGRCFWLIRKAMVLPVRFFKQLDLLVAGVVRQYVKDFEPAGTDPRDLREITKQVGKAIPRKLKQELEVFAYECSGEAVDLAGLGPSLIHSANRAGLLACRSLEAAVTALRRVDGRFEQPRTPEERVALLQDNAEVEELLRFAVSDAHFELRRRMNVAIR